MWPWHWIILSHPCHLDKRTKNRMEAFNLMIFTAFHSINIQSVVSSRNTIKNRCCDLGRTWKDTLVTACHSSYQSQLQSCFQCGLGINQFESSMSESSRLACKWLQIYIKTCGKVVALQEDGAPESTLEESLQIHNICPGEIFGHNQWRSQCFQDQPVPWWHLSFFLH
jgi:hypothetical protein